MGIYLAAASVIGAGISAYGASSSQKSAAKQKQQAYDNARGTLYGFQDRGSDWLASAFGDKLNPEEFLYKPVDLTKSQLDTIKGNIKATPSAIELADKVNPAIWENDQNRIRNLMPGYDAAKDSYIGTTRRLQEGLVPFSDVMDITADSSAMAAAGGTPGGSRSLTMRDLGLSRLDAMQQGNSMFAEFVQIAQQISPVEHQFRPQQMFFTPSERAQLDIEQAALEQQGRASAEQARAMPDPAQYALANAEIGIEMAALGKGYSPSSGAGWAALGKGITSAASIYANRRSAQQPVYYGQSPQGGGGSYYGAPPSGYPDANTVQFEESPYSTFSPNKSDINNY
jgi:hypothetical protein